MNNLSREFELLLGHAAFKLWPDLPRDMQEKLFETAVPDSPRLRYGFAVFLLPRVRPCTLVMASRWNGRTAVATFRTSHAKLAGLGGCAVAS
jgi:hypothetical protein